MNKPILTCFIFLVLMGFSFGMKETIAAEKILDVGHLRESPLSLTDYLAVLEDPTTKLTLAQIQTPEIASQFARQSAGSALSYGYTSSAYWLRLILNNDTDAPLERMIEVSEARLSYVDFYLSSQNHNYTMIKTGMMMPFNTRPYANRYFVFPITIPAHSQKVYYLRVQSILTTIIPVKLWTPAAFHEHERNDYFFQAFYFGMVVVLILFSLLLYVALGDRIYFAYALSCFSICLVIEAVNGLLKEILFPDMVCWLTNSSFYLSAIALGVMLYFIKCMINTKDHLPRMDSILNGLIFFSLSIAFIERLLTEPQTFIMVTQSFCAAILLFVLGLLAFCTLKRQQRAAFVFAAYLVFLASAMTTYIRNFGFLPVDNFYTTYSIQFGSILEMCLLPVALVDRFNAMNKQKERMQELSYQSQKLESISLLASGIGHDFNNILMSIAGYTRLAITFASHHDKHRVVSSLEKIQRSVVRAVSVVDKLLIFAQERTISTDHPICARQIVNEIVHIIDVLRSSICSTIAIDVQHSLKNDFPSVLIEPSDIHQLIINLVLNARDSIEDKRPLKPNDCLIKINVSIEKVSKETCSACNQTIQGEFLMINVEDTGMGIIPEKIPHLFEPFFTSKGKGKGMGLGLSVVNGIMHSAYGHIGISTLAEVGSVFTLYLPTHPSMASKNDAVVDHLKPQWVAAPLQDDVLNHSVTICVIDDDPDICDVLSQELRLIGYRVQSFSSSLQAWQYLKGNMNEIDVMITDYGMPEMSGLELANNVLTEKPLMPIIIFTGYSDRLQNKNDLPKGNTFLFKKPLNVQVLVQTIQQFFKVT